MTYQVTGWHLGKEQQLHQVWNQHSTRRVSCFESRVRRSILLGLVSVGVVVREEAEVLASVVLVQER